MTYVVNTQVVAQPLVLYWQQICLAENTISKFCPVVELISFLIFSSFISRRDEIK